MCSTARTSWGAGWTDGAENFHYDLWMQAFADTGIDPAFYANRARDTDEILPWDFIDIGIDKAFLLREWERAQRAETTPDCRGTMQRLRVAACERIVSGMRMMVMFAKSYTARFIGHLDLMRTMQRALRPQRLTRPLQPGVQSAHQAQLRVRRSAWESPGSGEIMDVPMEGECGEEMFTSALNRVLPECLKAASVRAIDDKFPTLMGLVAGSRYPHRDGRPARRFLRAL